MNREELIARLLALPEDIRDVEDRLLLADLALDRAKRKLQLSEDNHLLGGCIDGKNEATRAAQLRLYTAVEALEVDTAQETVARLRIDLHYLQAEHSSLKAIARLLAGEKE